MAERLTLLLEKQLAGNLSHSERWELKGLILEPALQDDLRAFMETAWTKTGEDISMSEEKVTSFFQGILDSKTRDNNNRDDNNNDATGAAGKTPVVEMEPALRKRAGWRRWVAAASVIILLGAGAYFLFINKPGRQKDIVKTNKSDDIKAPEKNRATITLANGQKVFLDSATTGQLAMQTNIRITKTADGKVIYESTVGSESTEMQYNTLSNPRGSKVIDMTLTDGSHVWLNSGSSITFPVAFTGRERKVSIDGEAYFEIEHDARKPFIVSKGEATVQVLGTHFNINAYNDDEEIKVTLLQGSVKVASRGNEVKIKPGEQAKVGSDIKVVKDIDVDDILSWKNGMFLLDNTDLATIMKQISRWYDVNVVYEGKIADRKFGGGVSRNLPLSKVLELLRSNGIETELEGKMLKVK